MIQINGTIKLGQSIDAATRKAMVEMGMFLAILSVGILYGWREGVFRWE